MTDSPAKTMVVLARVIIRVGVAVWFGFLCLWSYYGFSRPTSKQPESGRLYPLDTHGHVAYLTVAEINNLHYVRDTGLGLVLVAVVMGLIVEMREGRNAQGQSNQGDHAAVRMWQPVLA